MCLISVYDMHNDIYLIKISIPRFKEVLPAAVYPKFPSLYHLVLSSCPDMSDLFAKMPMLSGLLCVQLISSPRCKPKSPANERLTFSQFWFLISSCHFENYNGNSPRSEKWKNNVQLKVLATWRFVDTNSDCLVYLFSVVKIWDWIHRRA